ncbi:probable serine/threonine-protein kinase PBL23 [Eucalyptus grandis]|uniref:probable serine/threonine-protein kinase PBL23 n=1 Tax=Eucalyptus grandis TaxID=71139 RepID=UPI00192EC065|nr:probable serine/threonine-protein kinase PBL23 [Eucalyptus grandis]
METPTSPSHVIVAYDATKVRNEHEFTVTLHNMQTRGDILRGGDTIVMLGVLHKVQHPMGYHLATTPDVSSVRAVEEEVSKKIETFEHMLLGCAENCEDQRINLEVKITAGYPLKQVILQEVMTCKPTCVILDRHLRRDLRFYLKQIPCKVAIIQDSLSVDVLRPETAIDTDSMEHKSFYSITKSVLPTKEENNIISIYQGIQKKTASRGRFSEAPILCSSCGTRTKLYIKDAMPFSFNEIQLATQDFSKDNLVGEGGYGYVYKGQLKDGQEIAAKVRKEASTQGFMEFNSEIHVLSFARHKNIVMLLGYCCKENLNVLVYEYICNKSLDWHLFDNPTSVLEWHRRYAIAIGTAKGLRFLHEEYRGGPIIHRDMRPGNILLTHDFVPMLGDFGLAKWKTSDDPEHTRILGTLGYLAPEYAENGMVSIRTDVYAYGMVLLQLISGRKVVDPKSDKPHQSLRQWAEPLLEKMELHELIDDRIGECYDTYELYLMAKAIHLCLKRNPELRPSMGEVVQILEGKPNRMHNWREHQMIRAMENDGQHMSGPDGKERSPTRIFPPSATSLARSIWRPLGGASAARLPRRGRGRVRDRRPAGESSTAEQSDSLPVDEVGGGGCDRQMFGRRVISSRASSYSQLS